MAKPSQRRKSRELALQVLYQMEHGSGPDEALELFCANFDAPAEQMDYTRRLVSGIGRRGAEIDQALGAACRSWRLERMTRVDRNILRLAAFEMLHSDGEVPPRVAINEAVELAKRFGGDDSPGFINAVLDQLMAESQTG